VGDVLGKDYYPGRFAKAIKGMDTLIIDEASMVRADLLDMVEAALRRFGPNPGEAFGGVQVVLVGDLFQLPPVVAPSELDFFSTRYKTEFFFSADSFERDLFPTVVLTKVFRQIGDRRLTAILNAVREGVLVDEVESELGARVIPDFEPPDDEFWLTLASTNSIVTSRNHLQLERLPTREHVRIATHTGDLELFDVSVEEVLRYKEGAQVMMLTNDTSNRWVNGTLGRIVSVEDDAEPLVTIEFRDGRTAHAGLHTWEVTRPVVESGVLRHEVVGTFTQLPFKLAWAITIHKSQGQTVDNLIVDLAGGAFASGQVYVALSRCTSLGGLVLKQRMRPKDLKTDRRVIRFMQQAMSTTAGAKYCAIATLSVGNVGRMWRPRPVELAVAFDDGTSLSTLINPASDLFTARDDYNITVADVLLAPSLVEAWSVLGPVLEGWTPVGVDIDTTLGHIDFELKRNEATVALPVGISIPEDVLAPAEQLALVAPSALGRATAQLAAFQRLGLEDAAAGPFGDAREFDVRATFLLTRDPWAPVPQPPQMPSFSGLAEISRELSAVLLDGATAANAKRRSETLDGVRRLVGQGLTMKVRGLLPLPSTLAEKLSEVDELLGTSLVSAHRGAIAETPSIEAVLLHGAVFCISGTPHTRSGDRIEKSEVGALAARHGLVWVDRFGKKVCDVLVVAEERSQSGKAKKAAEWGMPVFSLDQFWQWLECDPREPDASKGGAPLRQLLTLPVRPHDCEAEDSTLRGGASLVAPIAGRAGPDEVGDTHEHGVSDTRTISTQSHVLGSVPTPSHRNQVGVETLVCRTCGTAFERARTRGRKPIECPDCRARP
jgi:hypothetical protein